MLFSFQMTIKIMEADDNLKQEELDFFLKGNIALEKSARQKPFPWLPDQGWEDIIRLCTVAPDVFASLADDIERNESVWKEVRTLACALLLMVMLLSLVFLRYLYSCSILCSKYCHFYKAKQKNTACQFIIISLRAIR